MACNSSGGKGGGGSATKAKSGAGATATPEEIRNLGSWENTNDLTEGWQLRSIAETYNSDRKNLESTSALPNAISDIKQSLTRSKMQNKQEIADELGNLESKIMQLKPGYEQRMAIIEKDFKPARDEMVKAQEKINLTKAKFKETDKKWDQKLSRMEIAFQEFATNNKLTYTTKAFGTDGVHVSRNRNNNEYWDKIAEQNPKFSSKINAFKNTMDKTMTEYREYIDKRNSAITVNTPKIESFGKAVRYAPVFNNLQLHDDIKASAKRLKNLAGSNFNRVIEKLPETVKIQ